MAHAAPDSVETVKLLERAKQGDREAFDQLFAQHRPYLRQFVALRLDADLRPRLDPSDVVQETQLEAFRRLPDFLKRQPMPFKLWLRRTALERLIDLREHHVEAARRSVRREAPWPEGSSILLAQKVFAVGSSPSRQLARADTARRVHQAVAELSEADREILSMRHFEDLSYEEVGWALDIEPAAARKRYGRALLRLRKLLIADGLLEHGSE